MIINFIFSLNIFFIGGIEGNIKHCDCPDEPFGGLMRIKGYLDEKPADLIIDMGSFLAPVSDRNHHTVFMECYQKIPWDAVVVSPYDFVEGISFLKGYTLPYVSGNMIIEGMKRFLTIEKKGKKIVILPLFSEDYENPFAEIVPVNDFIRELPEDYDLIIIIAYMNDLTPVKGIKNSLIIRTEGEKRGRLDSPFIIDYILDGKYAGVIKEETEEVVFVPLDSTIPEDEEIKRVFNQYSEKEVKIVREVVKERSGKSSTNILLFYSEECEHCRRIIKDFLPSIKKKYNLSIEYLELNDYENLKKLEEIKNKYYLHGRDELPYIFVGGNLLGGERYIVENLEKFLSSHLIKLNTQRSTEQKVSTDSIEEEYKLSNKEVVYFYTPGCKVCDRVHLILKVLENRYGIKVKEYSTGEKEGSELLYSFGEVYGIPESKRMITPVVFIGKEYIIRDEITLSNIESSLKKEGEIPWEEIEKRRKKSTEDIKSIFSSFKIPALIMAGLLDGINPCAFALMVFFLTYLSILPGYRRKILYVGISFIAGVFLAYFSLGLVLKEFVNLIKPVRWVLRGVFILLAMVTSIFGIMNLMDYVKYRKGKAEEMKMVLPESLRKFSHRIIRSRLMMGGMVAGAFISALIVSLVELVCTGQIYLPTIIYVMALPGMKIKAIFYLLIYNISFVLPLIFILILFYSGITEKTLQLLLKKNTPLIKIITSIFFFFLSGFMITGLIMGWI